MADGEHGAGVSAESAEQPPNLDGLAAKWGEDKDLRHQCIREKSLLKWEDAKRQGCINMTTLLLNYRIITAVVEIWCPRSGKSKTVCLEQVKNEAGGCKAFLLSVSKVPPWISDSPCYVR